MAELNTNERMDARAEEQEGVPLLENVSYTPASVGYWTISGVDYRGQKWCVDLMQGLLPSRTQEEHAKQWFEAQQRGDFHAADVPLHISMFRRVYELHKSEHVEERVLAEDVCAFLREQINTTYLITLTRIQYHPQGPDRILHGYGLPITHSYQEQAEVAGTSGAIETLVSPELGVALLGTPRVQEASSALQWIMDKKDSMFWRTSQRPSEPLEFVAWFGADSVWAYLVCGGDPTDSSSGLGVRLRPQKNLADPYGIIISEVQENPYGMPVDLERKSIADLILQQTKMNEADVHGLKRVVEAYFARNGGKA